MPCGRISTASRLPQSRRLRHGQNGEHGLHDGRLKIAAVAATAAAGFMPATVKHSTASRLPQSRRLRPGAVAVKLSGWCRLKIAAVAATAAGEVCHPISILWPASRLPQSRRLRLSQPAARCAHYQPPQDCRSRGDCGLEPVFYFHWTGSRLKIAAVAATAAGYEHC